MEKLKILHIINSLQPGGAEHLLANSLAPGGLQEHADNDLVYLRGSSYLINKIDPRVNTYNLNYKGKTDILQLLISLRRIIKKKKYDIVHSHLPHSGLYTALVCPPGIPHIHTVHSTHSLNKKNRHSVFNFLDRKLLLEKKNSNVIVISEFNKTDILQNLNFKGNIFVLHNFIEDIYFNNTRQKKQKEKNSLKIIAVGNLTESKNYNYLIEIFKHLRDKNIYLDIFGAGDITAYQKSLAKNNIKNINFKGSVPDIYDHVCNYDLFIMASKFEGFGLAIFEAMASGIPVMISNIPSLRSIINEHAIYFDLDNAEKTAGELTKILNNEIDIETLITDAKAYATELANRENYISNLLQIYNKIIITSKS